MDDGITYFEVNSGDGDGVDISFYINGICIAVSMFPYESSGEHDKDIESCAIENRLIRILSDVEDDAETYWADSLEEARQIIFETGSHLFDKVSSKGPKSASTTCQTLHSIMYPETFTFRLKTVNGKPTITPIDPSESYAIPNAPPMPDCTRDFAILESLPQYSSKEVNIVEEIRAGGTVNHVLVNGQDVLCKADRSGLSRERITLEIAALQKISEVVTPFGKPIQVPKLVGYVKHPENGEVMGLLREWIKGDTLRDLAIDKVPLEKRQSWAAQIHRTIDQLHEIGVIWGDGKPGNVIIDEADKVWLIDFGGGWTDGWVDEQLEGTIEGHEQAVRKLMEFLDVE